MCSCSSSNSRSGIPIHVFHDGQFRTLNVRESKEIDRLLNMLGCEGGFLVEEGTGQLVSSLEDLQPGSQYRGEGAKHVEPAVKDITVLLHSGDGKSRLVFPKLRQSHLRMLLGQWDAAGLQEDPADEALLSDVEQLKDGLTYHALPIGLALHTRVSWLAELLQNVLHLACLQLMDSKLDLASIQLEFVAQYFQERRLTNPAGTRAECRYCLSSRLCMVGICSNRSLMCAACHTCLDSRCQRPFYPSCHSLHQSTLPWSANCTCWELKGT